jgi:hypothetical protein
MWSFMLGCIAWMVGLMLTPGMVVITADSPTDGQLTIDHWATWVAQAPGSVMTWLGTAVMALSILTMLFRRVSAILRRSA